MVNKDFHLLRGKCVCSAVNFIAGVRHSDMLSAQEMPLIVNTLLASVEYTITRLTTKQTVPYYAPQHVVLY